MSGVLFLYVTKRRLRADCSGVGPIYILRIGLSLVHCVGRTVL